MNENQKRLAAAPVAEDDTETFVGPPWIREARQRFLTEEDLVNQAEADRQRQITQREMRAAQIAGWCVAGVAALLGVVFIGLAIWLAHQ
ncbi:MAG TPA: hypothetical protein VKQ28_05180 [Candidatus Acidoferrum sp.]|nr:hypothetical protein [Candidatus Acidoferrum sp.]